MAKDNKKVYCNKCIYFRGFWLFSFLFDSGRTGCMKHKKEVDLPQSSTTIYGNVYGLNANNDCKEYKERLF